MNNEYELDYVINEFMLATLPMSTYGTIINIITTLDRLNNINDRYVDITNMLETNVLNVIHNDALTEDDKVPVLKSTIIKECYSALLIHGLRMNDELSLSVISELLTSLDTIYNLDVNQHEIITDIFSSDDEDGDTHKTAVALSYFSKLQTIELYDILDDVDTSLFVDILERFRILNVEEENEDDAMVNEIKLFINSNALFAKTVTYKSTINTGMFYNSIEDNTLYTILEMYKYKKELIPFEIALSLFTHYRNLDNVIENVSTINLENISYLEDQHVEISTIENKVVELINNIKE